MCLQFALEKYTVRTKGSVWFFSLRNQSLVVHLRRGGKSWTSTEPRLSTKGGKRNRGSWRGSSSKRQMAPAASCAGTARGDAGDWLLFVLNVGRLVTSAPCCSPSVPAHPMLCFLLDSVEGTQWFPTGNKIGSWGVREWVHSIISKGKFPSMLFSDHKCWHQVPAHLGLLPPLFWTQFNPHNLTESWNINWTEIARVSALCLMHCLSFLLLFLYEKF